LKFTKFPFLQEPGRCQKGDEQILRGVTKAKTTERTIYNKACNLTDRMGDVKQMICNIWIKKRRPIFLGLLSI
jgi:hypothetical protein